MHLACIHTLGMDAIDKTVTLKSQTNILTLPRHVCGLQTLAIATMGLSIQLRLTESRPCISCFALYLHMHAVSYLLRRS